MDHAEYPPIGCVRFVGNSRAPHPCYLWVPEDCARFVITHDIPIISLMKIHEGRPSVQRGTAFFMQAFFHKI